MGAHCRAVTLDKRHNFTQEITINKLATGRTEMFPPSARFFFFTENAQSRARTKNKPRKKKRFKVPAIEISTVLIIDHRSSVILASFEGQGRMFPEKRQDTSEWNPYN